VSGNHASRVFNIAATFTVDISGLTIADGSVGIAFGGGILNAGTLTVTDSTLSGNSVGVGGQGGGIFNEGTLTVTSPTLTGNTASGGGGISNIATPPVTAPTHHGHPDTGRSVGRSGH